MDLLSSEQESVSHYGTSAVQNVCAKPIIGMIPVESKDKSMSANQLGYSKEDLANSPYAKYFQPKLAPMQDHVHEAITCGGMAHELFPSAEHASELLHDGYWPVETGFTRTPDLGIRVFCLTQMPNVTPKMWDWWFGWHGDDAQKYKLWHPRAHINAEWADGKTGMQAYLDRTSNITEYLGSEIKNAAISFVHPRELGIDEQKMQQRGEVIICAKVGLPGLPLFAGQMAHQIREVEGGAEMRSRMWFGGTNISLGKNPGPIKKSLSFLMRPVAKLMLPDPHELLVHNAQEMQHLAGFLPELYGEFGPQHK